MRKGFVLLILFLAAAAGGAWFFSFGSKPLGVTPPVPIPANPLPEPPVSTLSVPFSVSVGELETLAQARLPEEISGASPVRESLFDGRGTYLVRRDGDPDVHLDGDRLVLSVPIAFKARLNGSATALGLSVPVSLSAEGAATVEISARPSVTSDWKVQTQARIHVKWRRPPTATLLGVRVTFQGAADEFLRARIEEALPRIDAALNESLKLRERAEEFWREIRQPRLVSASPDLWLTVHPLSVSLPPVRIGPERALLEAGLEARLTLSTLKPEPPRAVPLPPAATSASGKTRPGFAIELPVFLGYDALNRRLEQEVSNRSLSMGEGRRLRIGKVSVSANGNRLVFAVDIEALEGAGIFSSRRAGTVYILGMPAWDAKRQVIRLDSVDFDKGTAAGLVRAAAWIGRPLLLETLRQAAVFPLSGPAAEASRTLGRFLEKQEIGSGLTLRGTARQVVLDSVAVTKDGLALLVRLEGQASLEWIPPSR